MEVLDKIKVTSPFPPLMMILLLVFNCMSIVTVLAQEDVVANGDSFKDISAEQQLFRQDCPEVAQWPSAAEIKEKRVPDAEVPSEQLVGTYNWIRKFIQSKWLPDDLKERLIPLRVLHGRDDYFIVRYQVDNWLVQIKDSRCLHITVKPAEPPSKPDDIEPHVIKTVETFVTPCRSTENLKPWRKTKKIDSKLYQGILLSEHQHKSKPLSQLRWTSDGVAVYFVLEKKGGIDPKKSKGQPFEYMSNINPDSWMGKMVLLVREKKRELGHKIFGLTAEDKEIEAKYDKLIQELADSPQNPYHASQTSKEPPGAKTVTQQNKHPVQSAPEKPEQPDLSAKGTDWLVPVLIIAGVVLAGVVVFLLLRRKK